MRVIGVYNAEGTLKGELLYVLKKMTGHGHCSLCDITHGWRPLGKKIWRDGVLNTELNIEMLHSNELTSAQKLVVGNLPVFIFEDANKTWSIIMNKSQIDLFSNDPKRLIEHLENEVMKKNN
jgi:hypothetical protein